MKRIYLQKAKTQIARPNTIRDINKQIVLNYVRDRSPISRAEIARETELQRSTVSSIVDGLQEAGLIEEIGSGDSTGGRKPTLLRLKTDRAVAIGVDLTPRETYVSVADLSGKIMDSVQFPTSPSESFMTEKILETVKRLNAEYNEGDLAVGMSVPGVADQITGSIRFIPYFQWRDWNIARKITEQTGLEVTVENDANAIALAELWFGREEFRKTTNFITVLVSEGIGTGIVFDGQIYRGERGAAGEFGHMIVGTNAPVECSCGSFDCWEAHSSENAMIARYSLLAQSNGGFKGSITFDQLVGLANQGEENAVSALRETSRYLSIGISNLIVGLSPQAIVVSGKITRAWDCIYEELSSTLERSVRQGLPKTMLIPSSLGDQPTIIGSLSLVLAKKFASAS